MSLTYHLTFSNSDAGVERGNPETEISLPVEGPVNLMYEVLQDVNAQVIAVFADGEWHHADQAFTDVTMWAEEVQS